MTGPRMIVALAVRALPGWSRDRYLVEVGSELAELPWKRRWAHAFQFLASVPALRLAVLRLAAAHAGFPHPPRHCLLGFRHAYQTASTEDGSRYRRCRHCGREDPHVGKSMPVW